MPRRIPTFRPAYPKKKTFRPLPITTEDQAEAKKERDAFYTGRLWRRLRDAHLSEFPLCERCLKRGRFVPATVVHHKIERLDDPERSRDPSNLESLCASCHTTHHKSKR